ncbi:MAG: hypothetical protein WC322_05905 [Candidatus Paceibacterota bacterium]|jgi:hypothetical protein
MIELTANEETVQVYLGDIVRDTLETSVGTVPFEWSTGFVVEQAVSAIEDFLAGTPHTPASTGQGWVIDLESETHPQAEITEIDFVVDLINFKWRGSVYSGDCAVPFVFTLSTTPIDVSAAIEGLLS